MTAHAMGNDGAAPMNAYDWSPSALGAREGWPPCLALTVDILLNTPGAMLLMWGPQHVMVFNDAYVALCGPDSLHAPGARVPSVPPPAWSWNPAALDAAWQGRSLRYYGQPLPLWRAGAPPSQALDLYYTPVRDDAGQVAGVLCALAAASAAAPATRALRVLVVEDHPDARYLVCEMLHALGHPALAVASGEEALPALAQQGYDVLFSDVSLPGMSGIELARQALARQPGLQILFASGYSDALTRQPGLPALTLQKPYDIEQLQARLAELARRLPPHAQAQP